MTGLVARHKTIKLEPSSGFKFKGLKFPLSELVSKNSLLGKIGLVANLGVKTWAIVDAVKNVKAD